AADQGEQGQVAALGAPGAPDRAQKPADGEKHGEGRRQQGGRVGDGVRCRAEDCGAGEQAAGGEQAEQPVVDVRLSQGDVVEDQCDGDDERRHQSVPGEDRQPGGVVGPPGPGQRGGGDGTDQEGVSGEYQGRCHVWFLRCAARRAERSASTSSGDIRSTKLRSVPAGSGLSPSASRISAAVYCWRVQVGSYRQARPSFCRRSMPLRYRISATVLTVL